MSASKRDWVVSAEEVAIDLVHVLLAVLAVTIKSPVQIVQWHRPVQRVVLAEVFQSELRVQT